MPPTYSAQGAAIANLDQLVFAKAFMYGSIDGHTADAIAFGAMQNVKLNHAFTFAEMRGPESLAPVGVGVATEDLSGDWTNGVIHPEQFMMLSGGTLSYDAPTNKTTMRKLVDQEPTAFDLRCLSAPASPDLEVRLYRCLSPSWNLGLGDREWTMGNGTFKAYGQASVDGGKLFDMIKPGNLANAS